MQITPCAAASGRQPPASQRINELIHSLSCADDLIFRSCVLQAPPPSTSWGQQLGWSLLTWGWHICRDGLYTGQHLHHCQDYKFKKIFINILRTYYMLGLETLEKPHPGVPELVTRSECNAICGDLEKVALAVDTKETVQNWGFYGI
ncbi:Myelin Basic Protein [Manis pentadactyla]|nr:Myelin Basic Protein [Manis pentadactyla]